MRDILPLRQLGEAIRHYRQTKCLTQESLAEATELDRTYISLVERGQRNISVLNLLRFSRALGIAVDKLASALETKVQK